MRMLYACIRIQLGYTHIPYVCALILVPRITDLGFLLLLFLLILITYLGLVESNFHMFSIRVSRMTCFACLG